MCHLISQFSLEGNLTWIYRQVCYRMPFAKMDCYLISHHYLDPCLRIPQLQIQFFGLLVLIWFFFFSFFSVLAFISSILPSSASISTSTPTQMKAEIALISFSTPTHPLTHPTPQEKSKNHFKNPSLPPKSTQLSFISTPTHPPLQLNRKKLNRSSTRSSTTSSI